MTWRHGEWSAEHRLPLGVSTRSAVGDPVRAGDVIGSGTVFGPPLRVRCARQLGVDPHDLARVLRVAPGAGVERGSIVARTGRRFARAVSAPIDGRLMHVRGDGDLEIAPVIDRWATRSTLDGVVSASTDAAVTVTGAAWALHGVAAYGPDAIGEVAIAVGGPDEELSPSRVDVRLGGRVIVGGARCAAEAVARAHACGVAAVIAGAVPGAGVRALFGDEAGASGGAADGDGPTVLCLLGFGAAQLPSSLFAPLVAFAGARAAVHTASARLFVFAPPDAVVPSGPEPSLALVADWTAVRPLEGPAALTDRIRFPSEVVAAAVLTADGPIPAANVLPLGARRVAR